MVVFLGLSSDPKNLYDSWTNGLVVSVDDQNNYPISLKKGIAVKPGSMAQMVDSIKKSLYILIFILQVVSNRDVKSYLPKKQPF
jgi:hypothetical protein